MIFVEPSSFVRKLLLWCVCDGCETWPYYSAPQGECHKGVGENRFVAPEKSAALIATLAKIDVMFCVFMNGKCVIPGTLFCVRVRKADQCPRGDTRALWHTKVPRLQLQIEGAAKKMPSRDSRLALARLAHSLASHLQVPMWCHQGSVMKAKSSERRWTATVEGAP